MDSNLKQGEYVCPTVSEIEPYLTSIRWSPLQQQEVLKTALADVENSLWSYEGLDITDREGIPFLLKSLCLSINNQIGDDQIDQVAISGACRLTAEGMVKVRQKSHIT